MGNKSKTDDSHFKIDADAPEITVAKFDDTLSEIGRMTGTVSKDTATVHVIIDGVAHEATVSDGTWSYTSPKLPTGDYTYHVEAVDRVGNKSKTDDSHFKIDADAPEITVEQHVGNMYRDMPDWSGSVSEDTVKLEVLLGGVKYPVDVVNGKWHFNPPADICKDGDYTLAVHAEDAVGNKSDVSLGEFKVDSSIGMSEQMSAFAVTDDHVDSGFGLLNIQEDKVRGLITMNVSQSQTCDIVEVYADGKILTSVNAGTDISLRFDDVSGKSLSVVGVGLGGGEQTIASFTKDFTKDDYALSAFKVSGVADAGSEVVIHAGGLDIGKVDADEHGNWSASITSDVDLHSVSIVETHSGVESTKSISDLDGHNNAASQTVSNEIHHSVGLYDSDNDEYHDYGDFI